MDKKILSRRHAISGLVGAAAGSAVGTLAAQSQPAPGPGAMPLGSAGATLGSPDADKGAALINATRSGPGSRPRTQRDRNERDQIPLLDFCSGERAQDASPGLARAIAKVTEMKGDLLVPAGDYRLTGTAMIDFAEDFRAFHIRGMGNGSLFTWDGGSNKPMLHLRGRRGAGWYSKNRFENFRLHGNSFTGDAFSGVTGIQLGDQPEDGYSGIVNPCFSGLVIQHVGKGIHALYESDEATVFDCYIERFTEYGIFNQHGGSNWTLLSNHLSDGAKGSTAVRSSLSSTRIIANTIQGTQYATGIQIDGGAAARGQSPYIVGNYLECQLDHVRGIALSGVQGGIIEGNIFKGCRGATLIALLDSQDRMPCRNVTIGAHMHHVSAGNPERFAYASPGSVNCAITGNLDSVLEDGKPGAFNKAVIEGPFVETFQNGERSSRAIATQRLSLAQGPRPPAAMPGRAQIFLDPADVQLKVVFGDGSVRKVVTQP